MKTRPLVEQFEDRAVPTVTAGVVFGTLVVRGAPAGAVVVTGTAAGTFQVTDNGSPVGTFGGAAGISILGTHRATVAAENVTVNLNGQTTGFIFANLGSATDSLTVEGGSVTGGLVYFGSKGNDTLTLATGTTVGGSVFANLGAGSNHVEIDGKVTSNLVVSSRNSADTVTLGATGSVGGQVIENLGVHPFFFPPGRWAPGWASAGGFGPFAFLGGGFFGRRGR
jgi:hypothetical protein